MLIFKKTIVVILFLTLTLGLTAFAVLSQPEFGQSPKEERMKRIQRSPNYKKGKFQNQTETPVMHPDASYWKLMAKQFAKSDNQVPVNPVPAIKRDLKEPVNTDSVNVTWFGHSTLLVQLAGKNILIDPVFSQRTSPFQFVGPKNFAGTDIYSVSDFPAIDFLLISHDHFDHLDHQTIKDIDPKVGMFYVPLGVGAHLEKWGVKPGKIKELDWWDEIKLTDDMLLAATPARHFSGRGLFNRNETLWASYVIKTSSQSIYLGADSGYGPHFKEIGEKYGPFDLTTLECGQYNTDWPNIHMMPEETAQAHLDLKGKKLLPIHWGKFKLAHHSWTEPVERLAVKATELNIELLMPEIGRKISAADAATGKFWWQSAR